MDTCLTPFAHAFLLMFRLAKTPCPVVNSQARAHKNSPSALFTQAQELFRREAGKFLNILRTKLN